MSVISTAYDAFLVRLAALYPDHKRIPQPYKLDENSDLILNKGYGLALGPANNSNGAISCQFSVRRDMIVSITRVIRANEFDIDAKDTGWKDLFEDQFLLLEDLAKENTTLGTSVISQAQYTTDSGLQFVFGDKDNFVALETVISIEYFETIT